MSPDRDRSLAILALDCSTDKAHKGGHGYVRYYAMEFEAIRDTSLKLLEIGVHRARSHFMWAKYFQRGEIYGIDNCEHVNGQEYVDARENNHADRIHLFKIDQGDTEGIRAFARAHGPFDIVIDDGSHKPEHQISCFSVLFPRTRKHYVIEAMHPAYKHRSHKTIEHFQAVIHRMNRYGSLRTYDIEETSKEDPYDYIEGVMFYPNMIWVKVYG